MDNILEIRAPKGGGGKFGGGGGKGFKGSGSYGVGYAGGGHGGGFLPIWASVLIAFCVIWFCIFIIFFVHFLRNDYILTKPSERRHSGASLIFRILWKAFKYATLIQAVIWAVRKVRASCCTNRGTKKVGSTFYRKVDKEEKGEIDGNSDIGVPPPSRIRDESPDSFRHHPSLERR
ncbi:uncharacterized protein F4822DRAFT_429255 [Hypoxylon trugodes]|uniref:uncharacterized protein n=1 Tax=Hypoxylon trugodes TaxID=326681 RepID=UPI00219FD8BA|nr:uncharacterized protein F4822DRAFT_429255 [Hypoxylon trugodes]KAI1388638.1 hypothetical protein F4822DRAFT_429255 [Hypoxylon trugodes]